MSQSVTDRGGADDPSTPGPLQSHLHVRGPLHQSVHLSEGGQMVRQAAGPHALARPLARPSFSLQVALCFVCCVRVCVCVFNGLACDHRVSQTELSAEGALCCSEGFVFNQ